MRLLRCFFLQARNNKFRKNKNIQFCFHIHFRVEIFKKKIRIMLIWNNNILR